MAELSRRLQMSRTTVHRLVATLERHGFIERSTSGRLALGLHLFLLGTAVHERIALARIARPHLRVLAESFRVSSYLSVRDGDEALCVERVDGGGVTLAAYQLGDTLPLHIGAGPLVLLAGLPDDEVDRILAQLPSRTTADAMVGPEVIRARVEAVRSSAVAWADGDVEVGVVAAGVPVRDGLGRTIAAVSVAGLDAQLTSRRRTALAAAVSHAARVIGDELNAPGRAIS